MRFEVLQPPPKSTIDAHAHKSNGLAMCPMMIIAVMARSSALVLHSFSRKGRGEQLADLDAVRPVSQDR